MFKNWIKSIYSIFSPVLVLSLLAFYCSKQPQQLNQQNNTLTADEIAAGWTLLWDGKTFAGWHGLGQDSFPSQLWTIEDQAIKKISHQKGPKMADGQPMHGCDLITDATFDNYEFYFEWKISVGGNSGVKYNVSEALSTSREPVYAALGWEYQVLDDEKHSDNANPTHRAGALYDILAPVNKKLKPVGEFNQAKIVVRGSHGQHWLNGAKIVEYDLDTPEFEALFQKSKYRHIPGFKNKKKGHIVLQDHSDAVWFRNLKIREIK